MRKQLCMILVLAILFPCVRIEGAENNAIEKSMEGDVEWNIEQIRARDCYSESKHYKKVKVALLDSGVDVDEDIECVERMNFLDNANEDLNFMMDDITGHGTSIAGLICAKQNEDRACGIAANVELYSAKVLDYENKASTERIVRAIQWAIDQKVNIIHMSFGTSEYSPELRQIVKKAHQQGILLVAAAGNDGTAGEDESTVLYPGAFDEVLSVGATDVENKKASWSASGEELDIVAPGDKILSTGAFGGIVVQEGTSLAAAQVTGVAAVLWGKYPNQSNDFIMELIKNSANSAVNQNGNENEQGKCGNGMLDYEQAKSNYSKMKKTYTNLVEKGMTDRDAVETAAESIQGREEPLKENKDVNYVNGVWQKDTHKQFFTSGNKERDADGKVVKKDGKAVKVIKNKKDISLVKIAAAIPDEISKMKTLSQHPCFHGGGNYIANTEYLYYLSQNYKKNDKLADYKTVFTTNPEVYKGVEAKQDIKKDLTKAKNQLFKECKKKAKINQKLSVQQKRLIFLGVALHNATDAFSHRAYKYFKYNTQIQIGVDKDGNPKLKSYSQYVWAEIVHPKTAVQGKEAKKKAVPVVWEKLQAKNGSKKNDKNSGKKDKDQLRRIINYGTIISNLAIADNLSDKEGKKMPSNLVKFSQSIASYLVGNWKENGTTKAYPGFKKVAQKTEAYHRYENDEKTATVEKDKKALKVGIQYFNKYWNQVTKENKNWKISQEPASVTLPDVATSIKYKGKGNKKYATSIQLTGDATTLYQAYEWKKGNKIVWMKVKKIGTEIEGKMIYKVNLTPKKKLSNGSIIVVAYNGLRYKTQTIYWKKKIIYTKDGLKNKKKISGNNFTVYQFFDQKKKKVAKTSKFKLKKKSCKGYSKKKKGEIIKEIDFGKGKTIKLYPQFK